MKPTDSRRKIVISDYTFASQTGCTRTITQHIHFFREYGWEPRLLASRISEERRREAECEVIKIPTLKLGGIVKRVSHAWFADRVARRWNPDLIWGHGNLLRQDILSLHNCLHLTAERLTGNASDSSHAWMHDRQLKHHDSFSHIIANSRLMKSDLVDRYQIEPSRITVIYPGFDPHVFHTDNDWSQQLNAQRTELGLDDSAFVILFATSGAYAKRGVDCFLDGVAAFVGAIADPELRRRPVTALMIGKADQRELDARIRSRNLQAVVRYLATVDGINRYYQAADVLVHSAVIEEFGQVLQEAAVCGCPVIASKWVGATELMGSGIGDFVMDEPSPEAIAERLHGIYRSPRATVRNAWISRLSTEMKTNTWRRNSELSHELCMEVLRAKAGRPTDRDRRQVSSSSTSY